MYYPDELIEEIRTRNDIVDVISGYVRLQKKGSSYFGLCPFHNEKSPSFSVSRQKQMYYCFGCGAGGNVFTFLMEYENFSFMEAVKFLADRAGIKLPEAEYSKEAKEKADLKASILEVNKKAARYYYIQLKSERGGKAYAYLRDRGLSDDTIKAFGLGYSNVFSDDLYKYLRGEGYSEELIRQAGLINTDEKKGVYDKFWNRVIFPIMDVNSRVIGFGGRVMGDAKPKYLNSPETVVFDKSRNLYGLNRARTSRKPYFLLCEGYMDVISLHQAGFTNAVASLGTALTPGHASLIKRYVKEVYLTYDSDDAGTRAALRAVPILREAGISAKVVRMDPYKDPDEFIKNLGAEEYEKRIQSYVQHSSCRYSNHGESRLPLASQEVVHHKGSAHERRTEEYVCGIGLGIRKNCLCRTEQSHKRLVEKNTENSKQDAKRQGKEECRAGTAHCLFCLPRSQLARHYDTAAHADREPHSLNYGHYREYDSYGSGRTGAEL